jgi:hypothetical protein
MREFRSGSFQTDERGDFAETDPADAKEKRARMASAGAAVRRTSVGDGAFDAGRSQPARFRRQSAALTEQAGAVAPFFVLPDAQPVVSPPPCELLRACALAMIYTFTC